MDKDKRKVAFTLFIDPGRRVYVRRINVAGNTRTRDEVIRREMRQLEGGWYSADKITKSKQRVDRLGYFTEVNVETPSVPGTTDQVDFNVTVAEKPTGNIMLGAGFGSAEGVILSAGVSQQNVFGTGNFLGLNVNTSKLNTVYSLSFTQPYWTVDGVSRGFDLYKRNVDPAAINAGQYRTQSLGAQGRIGVPFTEIDSLQLGLGYDDTTITSYPGFSPFRITNYVNTFGDDNSTIPGTIGWARDTRDSAIYPTSGGTQRANVESGLPGGTLRYYKISYQNQRYFPLTRDFTLYLNGDIGYGNGLWRQTACRFSAIIMRAALLRCVVIQRRRSAPKTKPMRPIGGSKKIVGSAELLFPFPGMQNDKSVRLSAFVDAGMIGETYSFSDSAGRRGIWPRCGYRHSVRSRSAWRNRSGSQPGDVKQRFQFTFGQQF